MNSLRSGVIRLTRRGRSNSIYSVRVLLPSMRNHG
jgi:hypothetical protein